MEGYLNPVLAREGMQAKLQVSPHYIHYIRDAEGRVEKKEGEPISVCLSLSLSLSRQRGRDTKKAERNREIPFLAYCRWTIVRLFVPTLSTNTERQTLETDRETNRQTSCIRPGWLADGPTKRRGHHYYSAITTYEGSWPPTARAASANQNVTINTPREKLEDWPPWSPHRLKHSEGAKD